MRHKVDIVNQLGTQSPDTILETIHQVMHLYRSLRHVALRDDPNGLTQMEVRALSFFVREPGATLSDLVAASGRDKAQVARLISGLKAQGFLSAQAAGTDRRSIHLAATDKGLEVFQTLQRQSEHLAEVAVQGLDAARQQVLLDLLHAVQSNLEAEQSTDKARACSGQKPASPARARHRRA